MLRISGGQFRGRQLRAPKGDVTRPTSDMVRQAIFNLLGQTLSDELVLDVFCGSGAMGLEALSRGAARVWMVDRARSALEVARSNVELVGVTQRVTLQCADATTALGRLVAGSATLALVDPPYALRDRGPLLAALARAVAPGGVVVFETEERDGLPEAPPLLVREDLRAYGGTAVHVLRRA